MPADFYSVLQVAPNASQEIIEAAYLVLHGKGDHRESLDEAYSILSDPSLREEYDKQRYSLDEKKLVGNYRIISPLGAGGYARTYLGEHILTGKRVCIKHCKKLDPNYQQILIEEWNTLCDLAHYELPVMRDLVRLPDHTLALVMSYIPGLNLEQLVEKHGRLDPEDVAWIAQRILNALRYLHTHGVVHGDVKPQNVIIREENHTVVLIDFGLAVVKPTDTTVAKGHTDLYAPPEQMNKQPLLPESDFYSLGMTMIYALSGKKELLEHKEVPSTTPAALVEFIKRLVKSSVTARPRWETENLCATFESVRTAAFGRCESRMKPICMPDKK